MSSPTDTKVTARAVSILFSYWERSSCRKPRSTSSARETARCSAPFKPISSLILVRVDERCDVIVAEESGHVSMFAVGPKLSVVR